MSLELAEVGRTAAELMDELADELADDPQATVDAVLIVVALSSADWSGVRYRCSDRRPWVQRALLTEAHELADAPDDSDERGDTLE